MKNVLTSLGYGAPVMQNDNRSQQVHLHVSAEQLTEARERAAQARAGSTQAKLDEFVDLTPKGPVQ